MKVLRTPDARFLHLPDFPFEAHYAQVDGLRIHYLDEGPRDAAPVLLLHGEPSWSFLYRHMIPLLSEAGHRVLAPDLVGFGRSDKPAATTDYSYAGHVAWMSGWIDTLGLTDVTLFGQDWGSLIGLRLAAEQPQRFARIAIGNGGLPTGEGNVPIPFRAWQAFAQWSPWFPVGRIVAMGCRKPLPAEVRAAYDAPFPDASYAAGARAFPALVPTRPDDPAAPANRRAWEVLEKWEKPFLTTFSDGDPITRGGERILQRRVPGAKGQPHVTIRGGGHFLQEDEGPQLARVLDRFATATRA